MGADLDTLCTRVYCRGDDLLPKRRKKARRWTTYAEIVTLAAAQVLMGLPPDRRFLRAARTRSAIEWLFGVFCSKGPGARDDLLLLDSTPVKCGRSLETVGCQRRPNISVAMAIPAVIPAGSGDVDCIWPVSLTALLDSSSSLPQIAGVPRQASLPCAFHCSWRRL
jgi:hypothetical protein